MRSVESIIEDGISQGSFREVSPYLFAEILLSAVTRIDEIDFEEHQDITFSSALDELYEIFLNGPLI